MQDLLQRAFLFRVGEHYGADRFAVQVSLGRISRGAELRFDKAPYFLVRVRQVPRRLVRVEKGRLWGQLAQKLAKARLPRGNPARDSNNRHALDMNTARFAAATPNA
jgi:hypothetical protein